MTTLVPSGHPGRRRQIKIWPLLIGIGPFQKRFVGMFGCDELEADRQAASRCARHRDRRQSNQVDGKRADVAEIQRQRVFDLLAELKGWRRRRRGDQQVDVS